MAERYLVQSYNIRDWFSTKDAALSAARQRSAETPNADVGVYYGLNGTRKIAVFKRGGMTAVAGSQNKFLRLRLVVDIDFVPHSASEQQIADNMQHLAKVAITEGLFTQGCDAEIEDWNARVERVTTKVLQMRRKGSDE